MVDKIFNTTANSLFDVAEVSVGQHYYWQIGDYSVHGQVLIVSWLVFGIIATLSISGNKELNRRFFRYRKR